MNESGRKFVAASRKATRLYLCLCFAAGDLAPLVAAPGYIGDERHKHARSMPDLRALAFALAQRGLVLAASNSEEDSESVRRASELGYWMWVENAGFTWDELNRDGAREYRLELRLGEEDPEEPSALIGETFTSKAAAAEALILKVLASRRLESEFEGMALNHVSSLAREGLGGIRCLKNMHADLARRVDDAERASRVRTRCLLYTSPSPRDATLSRMPSSA